MSSLTIVKSKSIYRPTRYQTLDQVKANQLIANAVEENGVELNPPLLLFYYIQKTGTTKWGYCNSDLIVTGGFSRPSNAIVGRELLLFLEGRLPRKVYQETEVMGGPLELLVSFGGHRFDPLLKQLEKKDSVSK